MSDRGLGQFESSTPDVYIDNEEITNDLGQTVQRQKITTPDAESLLVEILAQLVALNSRQGFPDTVGRLRTIGDITTCSTVTTLNQFAGQAPMLWHMNQINIGMHSIRNHVVVS